MFHISEALSAIFMPKIEYRTTLLSNEERFFRNNFIKEDSTMLNLPESDYHTAEELCQFFESDSLQTIRKALSELTDAGYLLCMNNKTYAVNKLRIAGMKVI